MTELVVNFPFTEYLVGWMKKNDCFQAGFQKHQNTTVKILNISEMKKSLGLFFFAQSALTGLG